MFPIRDSQPSYSKPVVTIVLIVINILIFLFEFSLDSFSLNHLISVYGLTPSHFHWANILTSMFLHGGWMHVLGNMWFLWIFGDNIEDILGHGKYLLFYLLCGFAAGATHVLFNPYSRIPTVGASGAIAGVMGAYLVKFPRAKVETLLIVIFFFTMVDVPAWLMLIYWFVVQLFSGVGSIGYAHVSEGGTAWFAHVGGFVAGIAFLHLLGNRRRYTRRRDLSW
ncbi:MAG TPA: rhomboid family intramembrane serine protease [Bryobacteraceae bacterium]|nr:rhomboid family intramembrane serine protease [Bryobacteraceae bacterium]